MLPEPTLPKRRRGAPAQPGAMTPLFAVPDSPEEIPPPGRGRRPNPRQGAPAKPKEPPDLLTVTAERLRRALSRSFLRHGVVADTETAVHAAMNVIEPVLDARDREILRLRRLMGAKLPGR